MPGGKTNFNTGWLTKLDNNGHVLSTWCQSDTTCCCSAICTVCHKSISCANSGLQQIINHADGQKHRSAMKAQSDKGQRILFPSHKPSTQQGGSDAEANKTFLQTVSISDQVTKAETLWAMQVARFGYSYASCKDISEIFKSMFPGKISDQFTMSASKVKYLISDGLWPYFRKDLSRKISETSCPYSIQFDETGNAQGKKQCDVLIRFWNNDTGDIQTLFLKTHMFGHAKAETVSEAIISTLTEEGFELPVGQLIALGSDGPNVNKAIWKFIDKHKKSLGMPGLATFVPCTLHVVHNAFRRGLNVYGENAEQFAVDVFQWFKTHICQKEDYGFTLEELGLEYQLFVRHVQCRWLTLVPALQRILDHWDAVRKYFLMDLPRRSKEDHTYAHLKNNTRYHRITQFLSGKEGLAQVQFLVNAGPLFEPFLQTFQAQEPLIHLLFSESTNLLKSVMFRFLKHDIVNNTSGKHLPEIEVCDGNNQTKIDSMEVGCDTRKTLSNLDVGKAKKLLLDMKDTVIRTVQCLHPEVRDQRSAQSMARKLCEALPNIHDADVAKITDEWSLYRSEDVSEDKVYNEGELVRVDHYWNHILSLKSATGETKYKNLRKLVLTCLCLPHGNADVERSLSVNKKLVTAERTSLSDESVNGLRLTRDAICTYKDISQVPMSRELLKSVRSAHRKYRERLEALKAEALLLEAKQQEEIQQKQREKEELEKQQKQKRKLNDREKEVKKNEVEVKADMEKATQIFEEANSRLAKAMKDKDFKEMSIAQGLLDVAKKNLDKASKAMSKCIDERNYIGKKRIRIIDTFITKENSK